MKCELKYVAHSYKNVLMNIKYILIIIAGVCIGIYSNMPEYTASVLAIVPFITLYIIGHIRCRKIRNVSGVKS